ncbi:CbtA family protein [Marinobacterium lacunae]|nr:CbtA family protein [Marinobacterium lacunae]
MFRQLIFSACVVGVLLGLMMTALQSVSVAPIIREAEQYEVTGDSQPIQAHHNIEHGTDVGHTHDDQGAWSPAEGAERLLFTSVANICTGIGYAAILLVVIQHLGERFGRTLTLKGGLIVGGLCFLAVFVAPSVGLPPEIPGTSAAALESRQWWWVVEVVMAGIGLSIMALSKGIVRLSGLPLLLLPYIWVPMHEGPLFINEDPNAVLALSELHTQFIFASTLNNLVFWLVAGLMCARVIKGVKVS